MDYSTKEEVILNKIKKKRKAMGISQEYLAYKLQVNQSAYQKLENGKLKIKLMQFLFISDILGTNPSEFLV